MLQPLLIMHSIVMKAQELEKEKENRSTIRFLTESCTDEMMNNQKSTGPLPVAVNVLVSVLTVFFCIVFRLLIKKISYFGASDLFPFCCSIERGISYCFLVLVL